MSTMSRLQATASSSNAGPVIEAIGRDLAATPGAGGKFMVDGPFEMQVRQFLAYFSALWCGAAAWVAGIY